MTEIKKSREYLFLKLNPNHSYGWPYDPKNIQLRNEKEIWKFVKSRWLNIIESVDLEVTKFEESKDEDKKGKEEQLSFQSILLDKLREMRGFIDENYNTA